MEVQSQSIKPTMSVNLRNPETELIVRVASTGESLKVRLSQLSELNDISNVVSKNVLCDEGVEHIERMLLDRSIQ